VREADVAGAIDERRAWHGAHVEKTRRCALRIEQHSHRRRPSGQERLCVATPFVDVDRDDFQTTRVQLAVEAVKRRERLFARSAPACPEVHEHDAAAQVGEPLHGPIGHRQGDRRRTPAGGDGQMPDRNNSHHGDQPR